MAINAVDFKFTQAGLELMADREGYDVVLDITHVSIGESKYLVTLDETSLVSERLKNEIGYSEKPENTSEIKLTTTFIAKDDEGFWCNEIGIWDHDVLVAIYSYTGKEDGLAYISDSIETILSFTLVVSNADAVNVTVSSDGDALLRVMQAHIDNSDAHPQYAQKVDLEGWIAEHEAAENPHPHYVLKAKISDSTTSKSSDTVASSLAVHEASNSLGLIKSNNAVMYSPNKITESVEIPEDANAMLIGPEVTIPEGVEVSVPESSTLTIY